MFGWDFIFVNNFFLLFILLRIDIGRFLLGMLLLIVSLSGTILSMTVSKVDSNEFQHDWTHSKPCSQTISFSEFTSKSLLYQCQSLLKTILIDGITWCSNIIINLWSPNIGVRLVIFLTYLVSDRYTWSRIDSFNTFLINFDHVEKSISCVCVNKLLIIMLNQIN